jgi:hypothetical protein
MFWGKLVLQTYAQHVSMTEDALHPNSTAGNDLDLQPGAVGLASIAVNTQYSPT